MRLAILLASAVTLSACVPYKPIVSEFNGDSVRIQPTGLAASNEEAVKANLAEANRLCKSRGKKAQYASSKPLPGYMVEHLYVCL